MRSLEVTDALMRGRGAGVGFVSGLVQSIAMVDEGASLGLFIRDGWLRAQVGGRESRDIASKAAVAGLAT